LERSYEVVGLDNINDYYSPQLKYARLKESGIDQEEVKWYRPVKSSRFSNYWFVRMNLEDKQQLFSIFQKEKFDYVINLAAQAGVRYSIENPDVYVQTNILGFHYILEACRYHEVRHLVHASSSSVYGINSKVPFSEDDKCDAPVSLYAATKRSNELMAFTYSHLYNIPITCLRFFTVYGPWGRPDMAPMLFAKAILNGEPIRIFNNGEMERDFTYVEDIVEGLIRATTCVPAQDNLYRVLNVGNGEPVNLLEFVTEVEQKLGKEAVKDFLPMQPGDVVKTWADQQNFFETLKYEPETNVRAGVAKFADWFVEYYKNQPLLRKE
jgi:UDP-glucuronate 4-epimerase